LRHDCIEVDLRTRDAEKPERLEDPSRLLEDLGGIDPAFDRWLADERSALTRLEVGCIIGRPLR
jgi:hypothetical protein